MPVRPRLRLLLTGFLLVSALLAGLSCSSEPERQKSNAADATTTTAPVTLTWSFWGDPWELTVNDRLVRAFEREYPEIKLQTVHQPWNGYTTWLRGEWSAGRSPDVMFLDPLPFANELGELEPLDPYLRRDGIALEDFYPALLERFRFGNRFYGLPRDNDTKVIFYNRAHFAQAGVPEPRENWSWLEMREAALALTRRDGEQPRFGFGFEPNWWQLWVRQAGCAAGSADGNALLSQLDEPGCIVGMQFLQDLVHTDRVTPPLADLNSEAMGALFRNGQLAMMFGNHALIPSFAEAANLSWDVAPLPRGETRVNVGGGAGFVISQRSQHKEAAWQLVKFLTGPKAQAILAESGAVTPARRSVREDNIFLRQQPYQAEVFVREGEYARMAVEPPGGSEAERLINSAVEQVMSGRRPAAEVMAETGPRVRAALAANAP